MSETTPKERFTLYDKIVNPCAPYAIPLLSAIGPTLQPVYQYLDGEAKETESPSNSYIPVVVWSSRTVTDLEAYKAEFAKHAEAAMATSGCRACFSFVDRDKESTVLQWAWYDTAADYVVQPSSLAMMYSGSEDTDYCSVFGGWDESTKTSISGLGDCLYSFCEDPSGYLKEAKAEFGSDFKTGENVMIWMSKRAIKEGAMAKMRESFQYGVDRMFYNAPTAVGIMEFKDPHSDNHMWSLRVFASFDGFKRHFPVPSPIMFRMIFNVVPCWVGFPIGMSFSDADEMADVVAANPGNKAYTQYHFETDLIGPVPDFGKGF
mmetsp:Transcript_6102/g.14814  ORF Transcript_6102/g.14814 Transcript_6102/m.14814 type:complete len:319 (+) Transcript_6102:193-1149(+)